MTSPKYYHYSIYFLYALCCMQFFNYAAFNVNVLKLLCFVMQMVMILICLKQIMRRHVHPLYLNMQWIFISLLLSILSAWIINDQDPVLSYRSSAYLFAFVLFFYLYKDRPPVEFLEKFIWFFAILHCVLWVYAFSQIPHRVFGGNEDDLIENNTSRGIIRISVQGMGFLVMAFFLALNKYYTTHKKVFIFIAAAFFIFIVLPVTRQIILWSAIVGAGYIYLRNKKLSIAIYAVIAAYIALGNKIEFSDKSIIGSLLTISEEQSDRIINEGEDTRITEYKYFFTDYSKNTVTDIIGNGMPHAGSDYGKRYLQTMEYDRLFLSDVGYAMMFAVTGWIGLGLFLLLFIRCGLTRVPDELAYARMYMIYFLFANIAASWYAKADWQICMAIAVYLIMMYGGKRNKAAK